MTDAARKLTPIQPVDDADIDDPDTGLVQELRDSERPERILRAQELAYRKLDALGLKAVRRRQQSVPPGR